MSTRTVIVIGSGNAGFCAALAARETGADVTMIEKAPEEWAGGNTYFTAGAIRVAHDGFEALREVVTDIPPGRAGRTHIAPYPAAEYRSDLDRVTKSRTDPQLATMLTERSWDTIRWMRRHHIEFELMYHRQAYEVDGEYRFWGGLALGAIGGGKGLIAAHQAEADRLGISVRYSTSAVALHRGDDGRVAGVRVSSGGATEIVPGDAVVLAAGGFEANPRMRAEYLGPGWDLALVRGTPFNTGDGIEMALDIGAQPYGHWSGRHAVAWDAGSAATGDRELTNQYTRGGYPFGIVVNADGRRFLDEGSDFRNYTYAEYGAKILEQPHSLAYQIFDAKSAELLRPEEYQAPGVSKESADSIEELAEKVGVPRDELALTVKQFNASVNDRKFDPTVKDGKSATGITPPKSNWAQTIDSPPFLAFPVTCGITFTFGGLRIDESARVLDTSGRPIDGLFAAGELVGGLFYFNYPGGSGLMAGSVFGRAAGTSAAQ